MNYRKITTQTNKEVKIWKLAAWTLPFVAIAILALEHFIGSEQAYSLTIKVIVVSFFATSVFWWWWAIHKIRIVIEAMHSNEERFREVKDEIKQTREVIKQANDSNR